MSNLKIIYLIDIIIRDVHVVMSNLKIIYLIDIIIR